ncbi:hypothetical protein K1719_035223 [Acacia pycnantha]|nr:hypothetical protein K1719_035223 [Acacia pycnantha]
MLSRPQARLVFLPGWDRPPYAVPLPPSSLLVEPSECDPYFDQIGCSHPGCEPAYPTPVCKKLCQWKPALEPVKALQR